MRKNLKITALVTAMAITGGAFYLLKKEEQDLNVVHAEDAVQYLNDKKIMVGDESGNLRLDDFVTRAEFAKLICESNLFDNLSGDAEEFPDVPKKHWAYDYIKRMAESRLITGHMDGRFRPDDNITLNQAERIALRILNGGYAPDSDAECAGEAMNLGICDKISTLQYEQITREDAANIIYNIICYKEFETADNGIGWFSGGSSGSTVTVPSGLAMVMPAAKYGVEMSVESFGADSSGGGGSGYYYATIPYYNTEEYSSNEENGFKNTTISPLSTFSIDTDTASYSNMRRFILNGNVPTSGSIRTEELINYFSYDNKKPEEGEVFGVTTELGVCPWNEENLLARVSVQGEEVTESERQPQNLVFLIDVSGSMYSTNKLPLVKRSIGLLLEKLDERDRVSIVTYASGTNVVLEGATGLEKEKIQSKINSLTAGGGTQGSAGLLLAYEQAEKFKVSGNNRIILCTDGDFNVGVTSESELKNLVEEKRENGIYLSIMGFGTGNLKDNKLEIMADNGNGSYYYIDTLKEAKKVLVDEMTKTLYTIAKNVKIQVEFNPDKVSEYRLIGYENRMLAAEDFENDKKDAGELGAGCSVTALYEIVPAKEGENSGELRYQTSESAGSDELCCVNIRYKEPEGTESILRQYPVDGKMSEVLSDDFNFAASVSMLGMILNDSKYKNTSSYDKVIELARTSKGEDKFGYRAEFVSLVDLLRLIEK